MSIINYAQKEISFKIVYYGAGVVGKTANLQYIHQWLPDANRGNLISLATGAIRELAMGPYQGKKTGETALLRQLFGAAHSFLPTRRTSQPRSSARLQRRAFAHRRFLSPEWDVPCHRSE